MIPRIDTPPKMSLVDRQIADARQRMIFATTADLRRYYAERLVGLRFERGDHPEIDKLDPITRRALVRRELATTHNQD